MEPVLSNVDNSTFDPIEYLNSPRWRNVKLGLGRIEMLMDLLGNPQDSLRFVHVAGTNGKGSTCAYISSILRECGLKVGMFTSPYIVDFEERIQVDGVKISYADLRQITLEVRDAALIVEERQGEHPTEFELMCAVAFCYFAIKECDIVVLEVGLGGRYDSTNIVNADLCVITPIGLDHVDVLGSDISQIAAEKSGIIKKHNIVVSASQRKDAQEVLLERCEKVDASIKFLDTEAISTGEINIREGVQTFSYLDKIYQTSLLGFYQPMNASLAILACRALYETSDLFAIDMACFEHHIKNGIAKATWIGRFEVLAQDPLFIVDGAHNADGACALRDSILALDKDIAGNVVFIMGVLKDKDYSSMITSVTDLAKAFIVYTPNNSRALDAEDLKGCLEKYSGSPVYSAQSISKAVFLAREIAKEADVVVAFGTLYSIADIKAAL